jgi:hypothetical protein
MNSHEHAGLPGGRAATARDAALRRMSRINRLAAGGSLVLVAGFTALAAHATASHGASRAGSTSTSTAGSGATTSPTSGSAAASGSGTSRSQASSAHNAAPVAPAATQQPPVVVSGGS